MTLPSEEWVALKNTRKLLRDILCMNLTAIRKNAKEIRERAGWCLRHYPFDFYLERMYKDRIFEEPLGKETFLDIVGGKDKTGINQEK